AACRVRPAAYDLLSRGYSADSGISRFLDALARPDPEQSRTAGLGCDFLPRGAVIVARLAGGKGRWLGGRAAALLQRSRHGRADPWHIRRGRAGELRLII